MDRQFNFTKGAISALPPAPAGKRIDYRDTQIHSLIVQVTERGSKTYYVHRRVQGKPKRVRLGRHPEITPAKARKLAEKTIGEIVEGKDPADTKRKARAQTVTLIQAFEDMLEIRSFTPSTEKNYKAVMNSVFKHWHNKQVHQITRDMVSQLHKRVGKENGESLANLAMRVFRSVYNFARARHENGKGESLLPPNPVQRLSDQRSWYKQKARDVVISESDLPAWFCTVRDYGNVPDYPTRAVVSALQEVLLLTGLRVSEALQLRWDDIDFSTPSLTVRQTKNGKPHHLPLSDHLEALLKARKQHSKGEWVFPSSRGGRLTEPKKHLEAIRETFGQSFTHHDLRRTFSFYAARLVPEAARKALLNHTAQDVTEKHYTPRDWALLQTSMQTITDFFMEKADPTPPSFRDRASTQEAEQ